MDVETDFALPGEMGLKFERYYGSRAVRAGVEQVGGWTDNLDFEIHSICLGGASCTTATFTRPDGSQIQFTQPAAAAAGSFLTGPFTEVGGGGLATLTYTPNGSGAGTYTLVDEDATTYTWLQNLTKGASPGNKGILTTIQDPSGIGWTITYPNSTTILVTHTSGQHMTLTITPVSGSGGQGVSALTVTDPADNNYVYQASASVPQTSWDYIPEQISSVSLPGSNPVTIQYKYTPFNPSDESIQGLTEVDYNAVAHDLTSYDTNGNATSTSLADGTQKTSLQYGSNATGSVVTITNPLGHVSVYQYNANGLPISITGQASAHCGATLSQMSYDSNGNMQSEVDNNGNTTSYQYAANGQLQEVVEAVGTSIARTTTYHWDSTPGTDRLLSVTIVGLRETSYTYNAQNRVASVSIQNLSGNGTPVQTLTTTYLYTLYANGMVQTMSVIHPSPNNSDTDVYSYDALGNMISLANGLRQTTTYSNYNALGEPRHVVGPNGDATDFTYDGRGLLLTRTTYPNGSAALSTFGYDQFALVNSESDPDGELTKWNRNADGVLQTITRNDKDGSSTETFGYDAMGDTTSDVVARGGVVGLSQSSSYDELGRIYQATGNHGQVLTYTYDGDGNIQSVTNTMGHQRSLQYDALNRVNKITENGGATPLPVTSAPSVTVPSINYTGSYSVNWASVANATSYTLQEQINGGVWTNVQSSSSTSWPASGQGAGTYSYRVQGCNLGGCGPWSASASVVITLPPSSAPSVSAPASNYNGSYSVSVGSVSTATSYVLQQQVNGGAWNTVQSSAATTWSTSGEGSGTYGYRAQACNVGGCGPWSSTSNVVVTLPPSGASTITVPATSSTGLYLVSWTSVSAATSYTLQQQFNAGSWTNVTLTSSANTWGPTTAVADGTYGYRVQGCNIGGCGPWSAVGTINVLIINKSPPCTTNCTPLVVTGSSSNNATSASPASATSTGGQE